jgi:hypothetical protein
VCVSLSLSLSLSLSVILLYIQGDVEEESMLKCLEETILRLTNKVQELETAAALASPYAGSKVVSKGRSKGGSKVPLLVVGRMCLDRSSRVPQRVQVPMQVVVHTNISQLRIL